MGAAYPTSDNISSSEEKEQLDFHLEQYKLYENYLYANLTCAEDCGKCIISKLKEEELALRFADERDLIAEFDFYRPVAQKLCPSCVQSV